jgi:hypothetical protein
MFNNAKKMIAVIVSTGAFALPLATQAAPLQIHNNTKLPSTSIINGSFCSKYIPDGVTQPGETKTVDEGKLQASCWRFPDACKAEIFMTKDCNESGEKSVGTVTLSVRTGFISSTVTGPYPITGKGFYVQIG